MKKWTLANDKHWRGSVAKFLLFLCEVGFAVGCSVELVRLHLMMPSSMSYPLHLGRAPSLYELIRCAFRTWLWLKCLSRRNLLFFAQWKWNLWCFLLLFCFDTNVSHQWMMRLYSCKVVWAINVNNALVPGTAATDNSATKVHRTFQIKVTVKFTQKEWNEIELNFCLLKCLFLIYFH